MTHQEYSVNWFRVGIAAVAVLVSMAILAGVAYIVITYYIYFMLAGLAIGIGACGLYIEALQERKGARDVVLQMEQQRKRAHEAAMLAQVRVDLEIEKRKSLEAAISDMSRSTIVVFEGSQRPLTVVYCDHEHVPTSAKYCHRCGTQLRR